MDKSPAEPQSPQDSLPAVPPTVPSDQGFDPSTALPSEIPPLLRRPIEGFDPSTAIPKEVADQKSSRDAITSFIQGDRDMTLDEFKLHNNIAQGDSSAVGRTISGAGAAMKGVRDLGRF